MGNPVTGRVAELRERLRVTRAHSLALAAQNEALTHQSAALAQHAWETRMRAMATRDWAAATRSDRGGHARLLGGPRSAKWFSLTGVLGVQPVAARWEHGRLQCDARLLTQAQLLVDLGEVFRSADPPAVVQATLTGSPAAVMLTLAQACDSVSSVDFEPPPQ